MVADAAADPSPRLNDDATNEETFRGKGKQIEAEREHRERSDAEQQRSVRHCPSDTRTQEVDTRRLVPSRDVTASEQFVDDVAAGQSFELVADRWTK